MNRNSKIIGSILAIAVLISISVFVLPFGIAPNSVGTNHKNVTVLTHVNITNSKPDVLNVTVYEALNFSARNITVSAGSFKTVFCNATIRDWNGFNDVIYVNATLWHIATSSFDAVDDNNSHYTNSSCTLNSTGSSSELGSYICAFDVIYYSNNGTWNCNVTVMDNINKTGFGYNRTTLYPVYALNVTDGIDYGNVAVEDYSADVGANLTNLGNMPINISVEGYGARRGDGLAMNCTVSNISVQYEKFGLSSGLDYLTNMTSLTGTLGGSLISNLTVLKQNTSTPIVNSTFWKLYVPPNPAGNCTGYIIFTALAP
jgi:hypothetical protein